MRAVLIPRPSSCRDSSAGARGFRLGEVAASREPPRVRAHPLLRSPAGRPAPGPAVRPSERASLAQEAGSALTGLASAAGGREGGGGKAGGGGGGGGTTAGRSWCRARWESSGYPAGLAGGLCPHLGAAAPRLSRPWLRLCGRRRRGAGGTLDHCIWRRTETLLCLCSLGTLWKLHSDIIWDLVWSVQLSA